MPADAKRYRALKAMLAEDDARAPDDPEKLGAEARAQAEAALGEVDSALMAEASKGVSMPAAYTPPSAEQTRALGSQDGAADLVRRLDPTLPLQPQVLAIQPATTHAGGDEAAAAEWATGKLDNPNGVDVFHEAPAAKVREDLMAHPELFKVLGYDAPMTGDAVVAIESGDPIHQAYNDYHWRQAAKHAAETGRTAYRFSKAPYMQGGDAGSPIETFATKALNAYGPVVEGARALVLGYDSAANWGAGSRGSERASDAERDINARYQAQHPELAEKAAAEKTEREQRSGPGLALTQDAPAGEVNDMIREEHPALEAAGGVLGTAPGLVKAGATKALGLVSEGASATAGRALSEIAHWNPANSLWEWVTSGGGPGWTRAPASTLGKIAADTVQGGAGAAVNQLAREGVNAADSLATTGETGTTAQGVIDRTVEAGKHGAMWSAPFSAVSRLAGGGRQVVEDRVPELVEAEPHLQWGASSVVTGPRLKPETRQLVRDARRRGTDAGDDIADEIAPPIQERVRAREEALTQRHRAESAAQEATAEGRAPGPVTNLVKATLGGLRAHHQPTPDGGQRPVTDKTRAAKRLFNLHVADASFEPKPGAIELDPSEATHFLRPGVQSKLFKQDLADAAARRAGKPIDRKALVEAKLAKLPPRQRAVARRELDDEIDQAIDDLLPEEKLGKRYDERSAEYKAAEQRALGEIRDTDEVLEPFGGSLAEYMSQRGKTKVYVTPHEVDAKRLETVIGSLDGGSAAHQAGRELEEYRQAALADRKARPDGGHEMRVRHAREAEAEREVREAVAPGGKSFRAAVAHGVPRKGDKHDVEAMRTVASEAGPGVRQKLDEIRALDAARDVTARAWFGGGRDHITKRGWLGRGGDAALLRAYPVLRSLDPLGGLERGGAGRLDALGRGADESEARRRERDAEALPEYREKTKGQYGTAGNQRERRGARQAAQKKKIERARRARERRRSP